MPEISEKFRGEWRRLELPELPGLAELAYGQLKRASREPIGGSFYHGIAVSSDGINIATYNEVSGPVDVLRILLNMGLVTRAYGITIDGIGNRNGQVPMFSATGKGRSYLIDNK